MNFSFGYTCDAIGTECAQTKFFFFAQFVVTMCYRQANDLRIT